MFEAVAQISSLESKKEFVKFLRSFVTQKFPSINTLYLDEAEKTVFDGK